MLNFVRVHSTKGLTDVAFDDDGSHFVTCGNDGDLHLFQIDDEENSVEHIRCSDKCSSIVLHETSMFIGTDRNELEVRSYPSGDSLPSLIHLTQPVSTMILVDSILFVGTKDFRLLMINLHDDLKQMKTFDGHDGPILSLSYYPMKNYLCSTCCDGSIRIFNVENQQLIKQMKNYFPKSNDFDRSTSLMKTDWDSIDQLLAIPQKNTIEFFEIDRWTKKKTFENSSIDQLIHQIVYSPCRTLFIVCYVEGHLSIVKRENFEIFFNYSHSDGICSLKWNPKSPHRFICTTFNGEYSHGNIDQYLNKSNDDIESIEKEISTKKEKKKKILLIDDESNDGENLSIENDENIRQDQDDEEEKPSKKKFNSMDDETSLLMLMEKMRGEVQEPFQLTSTSKYLDSRYLVMNSIGLICCYNEQIQIKFHDISHHHSITIDNKTTKYTLGDLSLKSVLLGSEETNEILALNYSSCDTTNKQFQISIDKNERIQLVKLTDDYFVVLTQMKFIRLFSLSGIQQRIIRFQGPPITLSSFQNQIFLLHHSSQGLGKDLSVCYLIIDFDDDRQYSGLLPLTAKSKINWIGYSDNGRCYYGEKSGHLSLLRRTTNDQYQSFLVANLKDEAEKNHLTSYWLIGLNDQGGQIQLRVVELRHQSYPDVYPLPLITIVFPSIPFIQNDPEQNQLENDLFKMKTFVNDDRDEDDENAERQCLIKMFAISCKNNREGRALEICSWMDRMALQLALKYATKSGKLTLAQMISDQFIDENSQQFQDKQKEKQIEEHRSITKSTIKTNSNCQDDVMFIDEDKIRSSSSLTSAVVAGDRSKSNSFSNPFKRKIVDKCSNQREENLSTKSSTINDQFSDFKPSKITKSKLNSTENSTLNVNEDQQMNGKRKIDEENFDENPEETNRNKRNRFKEFICQN